MAGNERFDSAEMQQIQEVMETGVFMRYGSEALRKGRWKAKEMESAICKATGAKHSLLVSSGTAALTTTIAALGVGAGDEVIMPPFTFVASFESVMAAGATPVLADIDDTLCLCPEAARAAITPRTKIVMPVHMCGSAARVDELNSLCREKGVYLLEDACQAFGATYHGRALGTIGDAGCYSFDFNKFITCGEGGAMVTDSEELYRRADMYHDHGHDHSNPDRGLEDHPFIGYNYRISELNAAIGCAQVPKLEKFLGIQRAHKKAFCQAFDGLSGVTPRYLPDPEGDCATFFSFFMPSEEQARRAAAAIKASGVEGVFHWYDNNWHYIRKWEHFKNRAFANPASSDILKGMPDYSKADFSKSDAIISRCISIAIKMGWTESDALDRAEKTAKAVRSVL